MCTRLHQVNLRLPFLFTLGVPIGEGAALLFLLLVPVVHCTNVIFPIAVLSEAVLSLSPEKKECCYDNKFLL